MSRLERIARNIVIFSSVYQAVTVDDPLVKGLGIATAGLTAGEQMQTASPLGIFTGIYSAGIAAGENKPISAITGILMAAGSAFLLSNYYLNRK